jgi:hypothetical protein
LDFKLFKNDVSKIVESNCPKCNGVIFTGLLILTHPTIVGLAHTIQKIIDMIDEDKRLILGGD